MYVLYIHKHIYTHTFLHLHWGDQRAGDGDVVGILILKVQSSELSITSPPESTSPHPRPASPERQLDPGCGGEHGSLGATAFLFLGQPESLLSN